MTQLENIQRIIRLLNDKFFFHIDIDTVIPWLIIVLMYLLYKILNKYFIDKVLDSFELIKLIGIYSIFLSITMASYIDMAEVKKRANPQYSFFIIILVAIAIVVLLAWSTRETGGAERKNQKLWILGILYIPMLLLMLTNGRILEQRSGSLENLLPRSELSFLNLPGEIKIIRVGGELSEEQIEKVEQIINSHPSVYESGIASHKDEDNLIKPYAFVSLNSDEIGSEKLEQNILDYVAKRIDDKWISSDMYSKDIEFVDKNKLTKLGRGSEQQQKISAILKNDPAVADSRVVGPPNESIAYVVLKPGYSASKTQGEKILIALKEKIQESNKISGYLKPRWIKFIKKEDMPKTSDGKIKRYILQKRAQNWSEQFPGFK